MILVVAVVAHVCVGPCSTLFYQGQRPAKMTPLPDVTHKIAEIITGGEKKCKRKGRELHIDAGSVDV